MSAELDAAGRANLRGLLAKATPRPWGEGGVFMPHSDNPLTSIWGPTPQGYQSGTWVAKDMPLSDAALAVAAVNALGTLLDQTAAQSAALADAEARETGLVRECEAYRSDVTWWLGIAEGKGHGSIVDALDAALTKGTAE